MDRLLIRLFLNDGFLCPGSYFVEQNAHMARSDETYRRAQWQTVTFSRIREQCTIEESDISVRTVE